MLKFSCDCFRKINREDSDEPYHLCLSPESIECYYCKLAGLLAWFLPDTFPLTR